MSVIHLFAKIPWKHLIGYTPELLGLAQKIYDNVRKTLGGKGAAASLTAGKRAPSLSDLDMRVERLEGNELQQAELVRDMARQVNELSAALAIVSRRLIWTTTLALAAFVAAVVLMLTW
ncbi:MAG TPA: hypothetical protein VLQ89_08755 [Candidatus Binatia bacterium]|nr:hypothetical protein [Candidatus Binatia bacterium]